MFSDVLLTYLRRQAPRPLPHMRAFLHTLKIKHEHLSHRDMTTASPGFGTRKLLALLEYAELERKSITSELLLSMRRGLEEQLNLRVQRHQTQPLFIRSSRPCFELIAPARSANPLGECPALTTPYSDASWHQLKPLRMVDLDHADLRFHIQNDQILYHKHTPRFALYTLDCYALLLKYAAYCKVITLTDDLTTQRLRFLHKAVVLPALVDDQIALWLRNLYTDAFLQNTPAADYLQADWDGQYFDLLGSEFPHALGELQHLKDDVLKHTVSPQTVLSSLAMGFRDTSFSDYYRQLMMTTMIPDDQNAAWLECLKQLRWVKLVVILLSLEGNTPESLTTRRALLRMFRLWQMLKPWQEVSNTSPYRDLLQSQITGILAYLQSE